MVTPNKHRKGDVRLDADGEIERFVQYKKSCRNGEYWVKEDHYIKILEKQEVYRANAKKKYDDTIIMKKMRVGIADHGGEAPENATEGELWAIYKHYVLPELEAHQALVEESRTLNQELT